MYLFLGQETVVRTSEIIGVFDLDNASTSPITKAYLKSAQRSGRVIDVAPGELPKSFVVCSREEDVKVYLSQVASATLKKRTRSLVDS